MVSYIYCLYILNGYEKWINIYVLKMENDYRCTMDKRFLR